MPAKMLMTWDSKSRRWRKYYRGRPIPPVSCRQLAEWSGKPVPETKEGSYQVANAWWVAKRAEIDAQEPPHPHADEIAELTRRRDWCLREGQEVLADFYGRQAESLGKNPGLPSHLDANRTFRIKILQHQHESVADIPPAGLVWLADDQIWAERLRKDAPEPIPEDRTVGALADRFLARERSRVGNGLSPGGYANVRDRLAHLRSWLDDSAAADRIDADTWDKFYVYILRKDWSADHKRGVFRAARSFVGWLADTGVIPRPVNLDRRFRFPDLRDDDEADIDPMPVEDVRKLVGAAEGTQKELYLLLMANCGFTSEDVSDLHPGEVRDGRIVRRRSKTRRYRRPPLVDYLLWPRTATLIERFRSRDPDHVLLSERGTPLVGRWLDEAGKVRRKDDVALAIRRLSKTLKIVHPPKSIRKRSATLIRGDARYADLRILFLGHAPTSIADWHYSATPQARLDECVTWLGEQYGLM